MRADAGAERRAGMTEQNTRRGIWTMLLTMVIFSAQDGVTRHLTVLYPVLMVVMIRFWFFGLFVIWLSSRQPGGLRAAVHTRQIPLHILRGLLLVVQICMVGAAFAHNGLIETHSLLTSYPLMVAALSGPVLGEKVGWRRWTAIVLGFCGILVMLRPGLSVFSIWSMLPLAAALIFAVYALLTRYAARQDTAQVSFFWTGIVGAVGMTFVGLPVWTWMAPQDWGWMLVLCCSSCAGHYGMIRAYALAEASAIQPFAYLQLVFVAILGVFIFHETLRASVIAGSAIVVGAGLFTLWRQRVTARG
jgi:drug/metabolite transporter (DMT)-like permease